MSEYADAVIVIGLILVTINEHTLRKELKQQKELIGLLAKAQWLEIRKMRQENSKNDE